MTIIYTVISRAIDATILVEVADSDIKGGNFSQIFVTMIEYFRDHSDVYIQNQDGKRHTFAQKNNNHRHHHAPEFDDNDDDDFFSQFIDVCSSAIHPTSSSSTTTTTTSTPTPPKNSFFRGSNSNRKSIWSSKRNIQQQQQQQTTTSTTTNQVVVDVIEDFQPDEYYVHVYLKDGVFYSCLADDSDPRDQKVCFAYLSMIQKDFSKMYSPKKINSARAYGMDKDFQPVVRSIVHYHHIHHNELRTDIKIQKLQTVMNDIKTLLGKHIHIMIQRQQQLDQLIDQSDQLESQVQVFRKHAKKHKVQEERIYKTKKWSMILFIIFFIYVLIAIPCGLRFRNCHVSIN